MATPPEIDLQKLDPLDPSAGNSRLINWTSDINLPQFNDELLAAVPGASMVTYLPVSNPEEVLMGQPPIHPTISAENPVAIYISPSSVDENQVRALLAAHRPDPYYGLDDKQRQLSQIRAKLASGQTLTQEEQTFAMQALLSL